MRALFTCIMLLILPGAALMGQKEYNIWYFGRHAGLTFNTSPPAALTDSRTLCTEASTSMCDKNGNLLFYTNADTIYNRNHQVMQNGAPTVYRMHRSSMQGTMAVPVPGSSYLYYVFTCQANEFYALDGYLKYWVIDMRGDGGLGTVVQKERPLLPNSFEAFSVTLHANKSDYWIACTDQSTGEFICTRTVNGQFTAPIQRQKLKGFKAMGYGVMKFSPNSQILTVQRMYRTDKMQIYRFDNATGRIYDSIILPKSPVFQAEFSPDSRFLYASSSGGSLDQYDLLVWDSTAIANSRYRVMPPSIVYHYGMQTGPDGKIYSFHDNEGKISYINKPNRKGAACDFRLRSIDLAGRKTDIGGPYYPAFYFRDDTPELYLGPDTTICTGDSLEISCDADSGSHILWSTGDTSENITVNKTGSYFVAATLPDGTVLRDTIAIKVADKFKVYIGSDTAFCHRFSHLLSAGGGFKSYKWNTGDSTMQITVDQAGIYSVKVLDSNSCPAGDTIRIDEIKKPELSLEYDSIGCEAVRLSVKQIQSGLSYTWNTGDTGTVLDVNKPGQYIVTASHRFCSNTDTIEVTQMPRPVINLGPDRYYCDTPVLLVLKEDGSYLWSTGAVSKSISIAEPGTYWVSVSRHGCTTTDTIVIMDCQDMVWYIPNAFSPDGNEFNPVFKVTGSNIRSLSMQVYSRWGEKLYESHDTNAAWTGMYMNRPCQESAYLYVIELEGYQKGVLVRKQVRGTVTLLR